MCISFLSWTPSFDPVLLLVLLFNRDEYLDRCFPLKYRSYRGIINQERIIEALLQPALLEGLITMCVFHRSLLGCQEQCFNDEAYLSVSLSNSYIEVKYSLKGFYFNSCDLCCTASDQISASPENQHAANVFVRITVNDPRLHVVSVQVSDNFRDWIQHS
jgi:hypothetical protein